MFRALISSLLIAITLAAGCRHQPAEHSSFFRRAGWWERRMDRLETWNRRNGFPLEKARKHSVEIVGYTLIGAGTVALAILWAIGECAPDDLDQPIIQ
jgi:hypothetical protein